jgi:hypothetical protein
MSHGPNLPTGPRQPEPMHAPPPKAPSPHTTALLTLGRALASEWGRVAVQPTVVHDRLAPVVATHCALAGGLALLAGIWPMRALILLLLVGLSMAVDMAGGAGWVRALTPRSPSLNLIAWSGAQPSELLFVLPSDATPQRAHLSIGIPLAAFGLALFGAASTRLFPAASAVALLGAAGALAIWCLLSLVGHLLSHGHADVTSTRAALRTLVRDLMDGREKGHPPGTVSVALTGGSPLTGDGLATLLLNHPDRLLPGRTTVICWHPAEGPMAIKNADRRLVDPAGPLARRARGLGFDCHALCGGLDAPEGVGHKLASMARQLSQTPRGEE